MKNIKNLVGGGLLALALSTVSTTAVMAQNKLELSANVGITSDYVWRGYSQSSEGPAGQAGLDATYGMFYAGVWGSSIDFGPGDNEDFEVDVYAGIKPKLGNIEFDLGAIYYMYPGAKDTSATEYDFFEFKAGASTSFDKLSVGATVFYSPETTGKGGETWTVEGTAAYELPMGFSLSGTLGQYTYSDTPASDYLYWNAGISKSFGDHWSVDARYWDTDVENNNLADERFVGTVSFSF